MKYVEQAIPPTLTIVAIGFFWNGWALNGIICLAAGIAASTPEMLFPSAIKKEAIVGVRLSIAVLAIIICLARLPSFEEQQQVAEKKEAKSKAIAEGKATDEALKAAIKNSLPKSKNIIYEVGDSVGGTSIRMKYIKIPNDLNVVRADAFAACRSVIKLFLSIAGRPSFIVVYAEVQKRGESGDLQWVDIGKATYEGLADEIKWESDYQ